MNPSPRAQDEAQRVDPRTLKQGDLIRVWQFQYGGWYVARFEAITDEFLLVKYAEPGTKVRPPITLHLSTDTLVAR